MNTVEHLKSMRVLIARGHTKKAYARDAEGLPCSAEAPEATCWCLLGAAEAADPANGISRDIRKPLSDAAKRRGYLGIIDFNDHSSQEEALGLIDEAIKIAECP